MVVFSTPVVEDSSVEEDRYKLPIFDGTNYGDWRFRMFVFIFNLAFYVIYNRHKIVVR
jgi:hypothetical protein